MQEDINYTLFQFLQPDNVVALLAICIFFITWVGFIQIDILINCPDVEQVFYMRMSQLD